MEREVLFDRESLSWKMIEKKALVDRKENNLRKLSRQIDPLLRTEIYGDKLYLIISYYLKLSRKFIIIL